MMPSAGGAVKDQVRLVREGDMPAILDLLTAIGLFGPEETEELRVLILRFLSGGEDREFWMVDDDPELGLSGITYCAHEQMTEGTWNLYLIGVHSARRGKGRGKRLLQCVEGKLVARGGRILLVETSNLASFENTRGFYANRGFHEEARIRDFYKAGEDKVVYWKRLL